MTGSLMLGILTAAAIVQVLLSQRLTLFEEQKEFLSMTKQCLSRALRIALTCNEPPTNPKPANLRWPGSARCPVYQAISPADITWGPTSRFWNKPMRMTDIFRSDENTPTVSNARPRSGL